MIVQERQRQKAGNGRNSRATKAAGARRFNLHTLLWDGLTVPCVGVIYWVVHSQGIRMQMPVFGLRLHKLPLPGFSYLSRFENLYRLDLAHIFALFLLLAVMGLSVAMMRIYLFGDDTRWRPPEVDATKYRSAVLAVGGALVIGDVVVFYCGVSNRVDSLWGTGSVFVPVVASIVYLAVLGFISFVHVILELNSSR